MGFRDKSDDSDQLRCSRHRKKKDKKQKRKGPSHLISPPSYSVVEELDGRLINPTLNLAWPERPRSGRHSINEYLKRRGKVASSATSAASASSTAADTDDQTTEEVRVSLRDNNDSKSSKKSSTSRRYEKEPDEILEVDELTERSQRIEFVEQQARERKRGDKERKREKEKKKEKRRNRKRLEDASDNEVVESLVSLDSYKPSHQHRESHESRRKREDLSSKASSTSKTTLNDSFECGRGSIFPSLIQSHFAGVQDENAISNILRPTQFVLYYKRVSVKKLDDLPFAIPLTLAYMSNHGLVHHFPVEVDTRGDGRTFWNVDLGPENKDQQPYFSSISALITFYESFVSLKKNGNVEIFPVSDSDEE